MRPKLADLFNKYGSDKSINGYAPLYRTLFEDMRSKHIDFMEIGIGTMIPGASSSMVGYALPGYAPGGSLRAWRDYFDNGRVYGVDIAPDTQFSEERITTYLCNSTDIGEVDSLIQKNDVPQMDVILDDGCHASESQIATLKNLWPLLRAGGIYVIEDIFPGSATSSNPDLIKSVVGDEDFFYVGFLNNQCVIRKTIR